MWTCASVRTSFEVMEKFNLEEIEVVGTPDGGDVVISAKAFVVFQGKRWAATAGGRLTAAEQRGGKTQRAEEDEVLGKLIKVARKSTEP